MIRQCKKIKEIGPTQQHCVGGLLFLFPLQFNSGDKIPLIILDSFKQAQHGLSTKLLIEQMHCSNTQLFCGQPMFVFHFCHNRQTFRASVRCAVLRRSEERFVDKQVLEKRWLHRYRFCYLQRISQNQLANTDVLVTMLSLFIIPIFRKTHK